MSPDDQSDSGSELRSIPGSPEPQTLLQSNIAESSTLHEPNTVTADTDEAGNEPEKIRLATVRRWPLDSRFVSIEYPGYVRDLSKAMRTINNGDMSYISEKFRTANLKSPSASFELDLNPDPPVSAASGSRGPHFDFRHPAMGHITPVYNHLLQITRRRRRKKSTGDFVDEGEFKVEITGMIEKTARFRGIYLLKSHCPVQGLKGRTAMVDFQFMPDPDLDVVKLAQHLYNGDGKLESRIRRLKSAKSAFCSRCSASIQLQDFGRRLRTPDTFAANKSSYAATADHIPCQDVCQLSVSFKYSFNTNRGGESADGRNIYKVDQ